MSGSQSGRVAAAPIRCPCSTPSSCVLGTIRAPLLMSSFCEQGLGVQSVLEWVWEVDVLTNRRSRTMTLVVLTTTKGLSSWKARARLGGDETGIWGRSLRGSLSGVSHQPPSHGAGIKILPDQARARSQPIPPFPNVADSSTGLLLPATCVIIRTTTQQRGGLSVQPPAARAQKEMWLLSFNGPPGPEAN